MALTKEEQLAVAAKFAAVDQRHEQLWKQKQQVEAVYAASYEARRAALDAACRLPPGAYAVSEGQVVIVSGGTARVVPLVKP